MADEMVKEINFNFAPHENGGESLTLTTKYYWNGDSPEEGNCLYTNQYLTLQSYCNSATFELIGIKFTPENLRDLANKLEQARSTVQAELLVTAALMKRETANCG